MTTGGNIAADSKMEKQRKYKLDHGVLVDITCATSTKSYSIRGISRKLGIHGKYPLRTYYEILLNRLTMGLAPARPSILMRLNAYVRWATLKHQALLDTRTVLIQRGFKPQGYDGQKDWLKIYVPSSFQTGKQKSLRGTFRNATRQNNASRFYDD